MKNIILILVSFFSLKAISQQKQDLVWQKHISDREALPYIKVREADVFWSKRIWRIIDTREKQNLIFSFPKLPLAKILHTSASKGEISVYDNSVINADQFKKILPISKVINIGKTSDTMMVIDEHTLLLKPRLIEEELDFSKITKFKLKEDWFFNSATSTMEVRIIGIAPLLETFDEYGNYIGEETLYWIYYPDLRNILSKHEAYNPHNFAVRLSWDDIFEARYFASYIIKEDNVYDRSIQEYLAGKDALYESEKIKEEIFNFEHDLWSY